MPTQVQRPHRFEMLDGLRGLAALFVVQLHMPFLFLEGGRIPLQHAYLAVDFFFMLSGFVLSFAYGDRLRAGWSTGSFLKERWIRLYPLFLLSIPLGVLHLVYTARRDHLLLSPRELPFVVLLGMLVIPLPTFFKTGGVYAYPVSGPSWSLFFEAIANVLHATLLRRRTTGQLIAIAIVSNLLLIAPAVRHHGMEFGYFKAQFLVGLVRVAAPYTYGMVLFRFWDGERTRKPVYAFLSAGLLIVTLAPHILAQGNTWFDLAAVWFVFPCVILFGAYSSVSERIGWPVEKLGLASYAMYVLHPSVFTIFTAVWSTVLHSKPSSHIPISGMLFLPVVVLVSLLADRYWDVPIRRYLKQKLGSSRRPVTPADETLKTT